MYVCTVRTYVYMYVDINVCMNIFILGNYWTACMYVCMYVLLDFMYVCMYCEIVCMYVCMARTGLDHAAGPSRPACGPSRCAGPARPAWSARSRPAAAAGLSLARRPSTAPPPEPSSLAANPGSMDTY